MDKLKSPVAPFLLLMMAIPGICLAQIQGTIHDRQNQPLSFANVLLINQKDSSVVTGMMASDVGTFSITNFTPGKYRIKTSLNISDLFKGYRWFMEANYPELNINSIDFFTSDSRVLRFTWSHKFGNNKVKAERKRETGSEEERNRVN